MTQHVVKYALSGEGVELMLGCAAEQVIQEQAEAIAQAFREIEVVIDIDEWGMCSITHVNGREVKEV